MDDTFFDLTAMQYRVSAYGTRFQRTIGFGSVIFSVLCHFLLLEQTVRRLFPLPQ